MSLTARVGRLICAWSRDTYSLRFTSGSTPTDLLAESMTAEPFSAKYLEAGIRGARNEDLPCRGHSMD